MSKEKLSAEDRLDHYLWTHQSVKLSRGTLKEIILICNEQLQREWISVEERLPEKGVKVLTCLGPRGLSVDIDFISEYSNDNKFHYEPTATHWMPLPEPPKPEK